MRKLNEIKGSQRGSFNLPKSDLTHMEMSSSIKQGISFMSNLTTNSFGVPKPSDPKTIKSSTFSNKTKGGNYVKIEVEVVCPFSEGETSLLGSPLLTTSMNVLD